MLAEARRHRLRPRTRWSSSSATTAGRRWPASPSTARATRRCAARSGRRSKAAFACRSSSSWPGHIKPGVYDQPVIQLDLHATALAAAGVGCQARVEARRREPAAVPPRREDRRAARRALLAVRPADGDSQRRLEAGPLRQQRRHANRPATSPSPPRSSTTWPTTSAKTNDLAAANARQGQGTASQVGRLEQANVAPLWGGLGGGAAKPGKQAGQKKGKKTKTEN